MKRLILLAVCAVSAVHASTNLVTSTVPNIGIDMETNVSAVAYFVVNAGQLSGFYDDGSAITNANDFLRLMVQSVMVNGKVDAGEVEVEGDLIVGGIIYGDGSGLTNLNPSALNSILGRIDVSAMPTNGVWNAEGLVISNAMLSSGNVELSGNKDQPNGYAGLDQYGHISHEAIDYLTVVFAGGEAVDVQ